MREGKGARDRSTPSTAVRYGYREVPSPPEEIAEEAQFVPIPCTE